MTQPRPVRLAITTMLTVLSLASIGIGASAAQPANHSSPRQAAVPGKSLPAWGSEPVPQYGSGRSELHGLSVLSESSAWAVGVTGSSLDEEARPLAERWDGTAWSVVQVPHITGAELYGVVEVAADDVWMVGTFNSTHEDLVLHWDGTAVDRVSAPSPGANRNDLYGVTALGPNDVWAVGSKSSGVTDPLVLRWNGSKWHEVSAPGTASYDELRAVTAISTDDAWAVGVLNNQAAALHWDGHAWSRVDVPVSGSSTSLSGVSAAAPDDVWAVGQDTEGTLSLHWDGASWRAVDVPDSGGFIRDDLRGVQVVDADDVWAAGTSYLNGNPASLALHWNGQRWRPTSTPHPPKSTSGLGGVSGDAAGDVLVAGSLDRRASVLKLDAGSFKQVAVEQVGTDSNQLLGISAAAPNDIWAVGALGEFHPEALTLHYDGTGWTRFDAPAPPSGTRLEDVVAQSADEAWAVGFTDPGEFGDAVALRWDGTRWRSTKVPQPGGDNGTHLLAVDAVGPNDVWAVGEYDVATDAQTMIVHWDGTRWRLASTDGCNPYGGLSGITFLAPDDGWAVGDASICRWDGRHWTLVPSPQPRPTYHEIGYPLQDASGVAADDVWAVGGVVYDFGDYLDFGSFAEHWDGAAWQRVPNPSGVGLNGVEAISADEVWAVGRDDYGPIIVRWNGHTWEDIPTPDRAHGLTLEGLTRAGAELWDVGRSYQEGDGTFRSLVQRAPSPTQGAVIGTSNVGHATVSYTGPTSGALETDATGAFQVGGLPAGRYRFTLAYQGCVPVTKKVLIVAGQTQHVDLQADCSAKER